MESCLSLSLLLILFTAQGVSGQDWKVSLTHEHICAVTGSSVVMPCSFTHHFSYTITRVYWVVNATEGALPPDLLDTPQYQGRVQYSNMKKSCTLTLSDVRVTDTASYKVRIETQKQWAHHTSSSKVNLTVTDVIVQISGPAIEGGEVKLSCKTCCIFGRNSKRLWEKNGKIISAEQTNNNELIFPSIRIEDEGDYSCALEGQEDHPSPPVKLNVMYRPKNTSVSVSRVGEILEGTSVTLTCSSDANPPVHNYTWYKRSGTASSLVGSEKIDSIPNITSGHTGYYYCVAKNQYGTSNSTAIYLDVQYAPKNTSTLLSPSGEILEGTSVTLTCSTDANPPVESYTWYFKRRTSVTATEQVYIIRTVRSDHSGYYQCQVKNSHGEVNSTAVYLNILYPPQGTTASLNHTGDIMNGSSVILTCSSDANPPVENYTWYRRTGDETTAVDSGETITFTFNTTSDGLYYCEARNRLGSQNSSAVEVFLPGFEWQRAVPFALLGTVAALVLGVGLICNRRRTRISGNDSKNSQDEGDYSNICSGGNPEAMEMNSIYQAVNRPRTPQPDAVYQNLLRGPFSAK